MHKAFRALAGPAPPLAAAVAVAAAALAARAFGFGDGVLLGATPASALALGAALILRWRGVAATAAGFAVAGLLAGLAPGAATADATAHGLAALLAARAMRALARRRRGQPRTRTGEWLIFITGVGVFTAAVGLTLLAAGLAGWLGSAGPPRTALLAVVFEPLGLTTLFAVLVSRGEARQVLAEPRPALGIAGLALFLLGLLALLLGLGSPRINPSGVTLLLAVPFCLWVAMQRRSLDGAAIAFLTAHAALLLLLHHAGGIARPDYVTAVLYLNLVVAVCQLVHAVNRDRLGALGDVEAHKRHLEARVAERTARLSAMTERALAADAAKTRFLATVSHEVRTPLNGVIGMAAVVLAGPLDPNLRRNVEVIRSSGLHLLEVINRILDYSRLDHADEAPADIAAFDLAELVDEVLDEARVLPYASGLDFRADLEPGLRTGRRGYRQGLRQVLTNLVGNAAKFTDRGSVTVRLRGRDGDRLRIEVEDTGTGIPPEAQARIFLPFEQADASTTRRFGGTGLGLAISAEIVRRMGGSIGVDSADGDGARFWIDLALPVAVPLDAVGT